MSSRVDQSLLHSLDQSLSIKEIHQPTVLAVAYDFAYRRCVGGDNQAAASHRLGHGIGMQVHEHPYLSARSPHTLAPGMTMSDEPGIYAHGEFGVRIEDIVAVTQGGAEAFGTRAQSLEAPFG